MLWEIRNFHLQNDYIKMLILLFTQHKKEGKKLFFLLVQNAFKANWEIFLDQIDIRDFFRSFSCCNGNMMTSSDVLSFSFYIILLHSREQSRLVEIYGFRMFFYSL